MFGIIKRCLLGKVWIIYSSCIFLVVYFSDITTDVETWTSPKSKYSVWSDSWVALFVCSYSGMLGIGETNVWNYMSRVTSNLAD